MATRVVYAVRKSGQYWVWQLIAPSGKVLAQGGKEASRANAIRAAKLAKMYSAQATVETDAEVLNG